MASRLRTLARPLARGGRRLAGGALEALVGALSAVSPRLESPGEPRSILVLRNNDLGDLLIVTPLFEALRRRFPEARIAAAVGRWNVGALRGNPYLSEVLVADAPWFNKFTRQGPRAALRYLATSPQVRRLRGFDVGIDVLGSAWGSLLLLRAGIPYRLGVRGYAGGHTGVQRWVEFDPWEHVGRRALRFAELLGATDLPPCRPQIFLDAAEKAVGEQAWGAGPRRTHAELPEPPAKGPFPLGGGGLEKGEGQDGGGPRYHEPEGRLDGGSPHLGPPPVPTLPLPEGGRPLPTASSLGAASIGGEPRVAIAPGGGLAVKCWPPSHWEALTRLLTDQGATVAVLGGPKERALGERLAATSPQVRNLAGHLSLRESFAVLAAADLVACNSSVWMHAAAAFSRPTFVLLGESFPSARQHDAQWGYPGTCWSLGKEEGGRTTLYTPEEALARIRAEGRF